MEPTASQNNYVNNSFQNKYGVLHLIPSFKSKKELCSLISQNHEHDPFGSGSDPRYLGCCQADEAYQRHSRIVGRTWAPAQPRPTVAHLHSCTPAQAWTCASAVPVRGLHKRLLRAIAAQPCTARVLQLPIRWPLPAWAAHWDGHPPPLFLFLPLHLILMPPSLTFANSTPSRPPSRKLDPGSITLAWYYLLGIKTLVRSRISMRL